MTDTKKDDRLRTRVCYSAYSPFSILAFWRKYGSIRSYSVLAFVKWFLLHTPGLRRKYGVRVPYGIYTIVGVLILRGGSHFSNNFDILVHWIVLIAKIWSGILPEKPNLIFYSAAPRWSSQRTCLAIFFIHYYWSLILDLTYSILAFDREYEYGATWFLRWRKLKYLFILHTCISKNKSA